VHGHGGRAEEKRENIMGGKPSRGTSADKRLSGTKPPAPAKPPAKPAAKPAAGKPFPGAKPFMKKR